MTDPAYLNIDRENHPAVVAGRRSRDAVIARDKQAWLDNFASNATVEDPVGPSPFDEAGVGHTGLDAIGAFWDETIAKTTVIDFQFEQEFITGSEVAYTGKIVTTLDGMVSEAVGVFTYKADDDGKLVALRAFWEVEATINSLRAVT